jgi:hypothetical protein
MNVIAIFGEKMAFFLKANVIIDLCHKSNIYCQIPWEGCQKFYFQTKKIPIRVNFGGPLNGNCW